MDSYEYSLIADEGGNGEGGQQMPGSDLPQNLYRVGRQNQWNRMRKV